MLRMLAGFLIGSVFLGVVVYASLQQGRVRCEVCMSFAGRRICETARSPDRAQAVQQATASACARLSGGVTRGIQCSNTPPLSTECSE
jgi:hypothetical protein